MTRLKKKARKFVRTTSTALRHMMRPRLIMRQGRENLAVVFSEPHDMPMGDRIVLYGLIRGLKPRAYLEIGVRWGGSARIVANAMHANGTGKAIGLDPDLSNFRPSARELQDRYSTVEGYSPEDTGSASARLGAPIDFVFIDAVHTYSAVRQDIAGVLPYLADRAFILFHDAFHQGINQAVDEFLAEHDGFHDHGIVSLNAEVGDPVSYCGLRLVRKGPSDFLTALKDAHAEAGRDTPRLDPACWDHDPFANRIGSPLGRQVRN